jgi:hypothetical protein
LLDEWIPPAPALPLEEALAGLALRYVRSHGPVSAADFQWWAGLPAREAHAALAAVAGQLETITIDEQTCYMAADSSPTEVPESTAYLLPAFDEFLVAYRNRTAVLDPAYNMRVVPGGNGVFNPIVVIDGRVRGTWKRTLKRNQVLITVSAFEPVHPAQRAALEPAVERYGAFLDLPATLDSVTTV